MADSPPSRRGAKTGGGKNRHRAEKSEITTSLRPGRRVRKDHPVIVWRGRMDSFCAFLGEAQIRARRMNHRELADNLGKVIDFSYHLLRCEATGRAVGEFNLLGFAGERARRDCHDAIRRLGHDGLRPGTGLGPLGSGLNLLRALAREAETAAVAAFARSGSPRRDDIIIGLNRLSSLLCVLMLKRRRVVSCRTIRDDKKKG